MSQQNLSVGCCPRRRVPSPELGVIDFAGLPPLHPPKTIFSHDDLPLPAPDQHTARFRNNTLRCLLYSSSLPSSKHVLPRSLPHGVHAGWRRRFHGAIGDRAICVATDKQPVHGGRYLPGRQEDQGQRRRPPEDGSAEGGLQGSVRLRGGQVRDVRAQGERQEDQAVHRQASRRRRPIHVHPVNRG